MAKAKWEGNNQLGGYVWHTTGFGKTMTSFKSAQLIAGSKDADKVIFFNGQNRAWGTVASRKSAGFSRAHAKVML